MDSTLPDGLTATQSHWGGTPEEDLQILSNIAGVDVRGKVGYKIIVTNEADEEVARIEYYRFSASDAGYIGWLEVDEAYRQQGIGFAIRTAAMNHLLQESVDEIWTGPMSDGGRALATKHGFEPVSSGELAGKYYVYRA